jgi:hypothetical protein
MTEAVTNRVEVSGYDGLMDAECVALCDALNHLDGIRTTESCCGHGERPYWICFVADSLEALPQLLYWFDQCHTFPGWCVVAQTDCAMSPATFRIEGPSGGSGYDQAEKIAALIEVHEGDVIIQSVELRRAIIEHRTAVHNAGKIRVDCRDESAAEAKHRADQRLWDSVDDDSRSK